MAAVQWTGLDDGVYGTPYAIKYNDSQLRRRVLTVISHRAMRSDEGLLAALIGAATGGTATKTHKEIAAPVTSNDVGGLRTISTINDINRVTVAGDVTALNAFLTASRAVTYPGDKSGNGK